MTDVTTHRRAAHSGRRTSSSHPQQRAAKAPPDPAFGAYVIDRIDYRVRQLTLRFGLSEHEQEDYRSDMAADVYTAMRRFDPGKAKRETFVNRVLDRFMLHATRSRCNRLKRPCLNPIGFADIAEAYEPISNDPPKGEHTEVDLIELRLDVEQVIGEMPDRLRQASRLLMEMSPADAARAMGIHPCSIYRIMARIREQLAAAGLNYRGGSREDSAPAADVEGAQEGAR